MRFFQAVTDLEKHKGMEWHKARRSEKLLPNQSVLTSFLFPPSEVSANFETG